MAFNWKQESFNKHNNMPLQSIIKHYKREFLSSVVKQEINIPHSNSPLYICRPVFHSFGTIH